MSVQQTTGLGVTNDFSSVPHYAQMQMLATPKERQRLRANAALPKEAWIDVEDAVYPAMDDVLTVFNDIRGRGLTTSADIQDKSVEWHKQDYEATANVSMDIETAPDDEGRVEYDLDGSPLPLIYSQFSVGFRDGGGQPQPGQSVEVLNAEGSSRVVGEAAEDIVLNGWDATVGGEDARGRIDGYTMYGLTNHPSTHTGSLGDWTADTSNVRKDLKSMMGDLRDDNFRAGNTGYFVYVGSDLEDVFTEPDSEGSGDLLVQDRLNSLNDIGTIKVSEYLDPDAVLMFRPTRDVIDLAIALDETVIQWDGPFRDNFMTVMSFAPRVKDTMRGQAGMAYYTGGTTA